MTTVTATDLDRADRLAAEVRDARGCCEAFDACQTCRAKSVEVRRLRLLARLAELDGRQVSSFASASGARNVRIVA